MTQLAGSHGIETFRWPESVGPSVYRPITASTEGWVMTLTGTMRQTRPLATEEAACANALHHLSANPAERWGVWRAGWLRWQFREPLEPRAYLRRLLRTFVVLLLGCADLVFIEFTDGLSESHPIAALGVTLLQLAVIIFVFVRVLSLPVESLLAISLLIDETQPFDTALLVFIAISMGVAWQASSPDLAEIAYAFRLANDGLYLVFACVWASRLNPRIAYELAIEQFRSNAIVPRIRSILFRTSQSTSLLDLPQVRIVTRFFGTLLTALLLDQLLGGISSSISTGGRRLHAVDPIYMQVLILCILAVFALVAVNRTLVGPIRAQAIRDNAYELDTWSAFRTHAEFIDEALWSMIPVTIAFVPAALDVNSLPLVLLTAIPACLIVLRIRIWGRQPKKPSVIPQPRPST